MEKDILKEKKVVIRPVRFKESTDEALRKKSIQEDRSFNYLIERAVRKDLGLDI